MFPRAILLAAVQTALTNGFNNLALGIMALHDAHFPDKPLRPAYDRLILSRLNSQRQLQEITPSHAN